MSMLAVCSAGAPGLSRAPVRRGVATASRRSRQFPPDGLDYHVAFSAGGSFRVSEIWDSKEQFEAFGQRLMPILSRRRHRARRSARGHRDSQHHQAVGAPVDERSGHHPARVMAGRRRTPTMAAITELLEDRAPETHLEIRRLIADLARSLAPGAPARVAALQA